MRGEVYELPAPRGATGHEQRGRRFCVVIQTDQLENWNTWVIAPTTRTEPSGNLSMRFRPEIRINGERCFVLLDQMGAVDRTRLGSRVDMVSLQEMQDINAAICTLLGIA